MRTSPTTPDDPDLEFLPERKGDNEKRNDSEKKSDSMFVFEVIPWRPPAGATPSRANAFSSGEKVVPRPPDSIPTNVASGFSRKMQWNRALSRLVVRGREGAVRINAAIAKGVLLAGSGARTSYESGLRFAERLRGAYTHVVPELRASVRKALSATRSAASTTGATLRDGLSIARSLVAAALAKTSAMTMQQAGSLVRALPAWRPRIESRMLLPRGFVMFVCGVVVGVGYTAWWSKPLGPADAAEYQPLELASPASAVAAVSDRSPVVQTAAAGMSTIDKSVTTGPPVGQTPSVPVKAAPVPVKVARVPARVARVPANVEPISRTPVRSPEPDAASFTGSLSVSSTPQGAQVSLNGRVVGITPLLLTNLPAGSRAVQVRLDGYDSWSSAVRVVADQRASVRANLTRSPGR